MKLSVKKVVTIILSLLVIFSIIPLFFIFTVNSQNKNSKDEITSETRLSHDKLILGFSQIGSESAWRTRNTQSIFEAAEANNIQILYDDAQQKQENQLKAIRSFIVYQVDIIAFVPIVQDGWDNVLQEAKDAGIPVIVVDRQINTDKSLYAGFLGEDGFMEGKKAADFLVNKCASSQDQINILELSGTENSSIATERASGFRSVISNYSKFNIIHSEDGDFLRSLGKEIAQRIIQENNGLFYDGKPIDAIFSHNDPMTLGLLDALSENNINPQDTIIITIDGEQNAINAMKEGKLNCVVECNPNLGPVLMKLVLQVASGHSIPEVTYTEESVFTENDDFSTYTPRGY